MGLKYNSTLYYSALLLFQIILIIMSGNLVSFSNIEQPILKIDTTTNFNQSQTNNLDINLITSLDKNTNIKYNLESKSGIEIAKGNFICEMNCSFTIEMKRIILENYILTLNYNNRGDKFTYKENVSPDFSFFDKKNYEFIFNKTYTLKESEFNDVLNIDFIINSSSLNKDSNFLVEVLDTDTNTIRASQEYKCSGICRENLFLKPPFILSNYLVRVYSTAGEQQYEFELVYEEPEIDKKNKKGIFNSKLDNRNVEEEITINGEIKTRAQIDMNSPVDVTYTFNEGSVKQIDFFSTRLNDISVGIEDVEINNLNMVQSNFNTLNSQNSNRGNPVNAFAIDPTNMRGVVDYFNVSYTARGTSLYKCEQYNFETQTCSGDFVKFLDTNIGEEYTFSLDPQDPLFMEFAQYGTYNCGSGSCIIAFNSTTTWNVPNGVNELENLLIVGGGGGGAGNTGYSNAGGGGGGAGGLIYQTSVPLTQSSYIITIGAGGLGIDQNGVPADNGEDTTAFNLTALGGGGGILTGGGDNTPAVDGGSGGGGRQNPAGQATQPTSIWGGFGNDGARNSADSGGAGGGGAGTQPIDISGNNGGDGGDGSYYGDIFGDQFGVNGYFAGGAGGGGDAGGALGIGGLGGGGNGSSARDGIAPTPGVPNTGGGGGGGSSEHGGADGGSGVVIIKFRDNTSPSITINSPQEQVYNDSREQLLNISASDNIEVDEIWYNFDGTNITYTTPENVLFESGNITLQVWTNDTSGNVATESINFTIEDLPPDLVVYSPQNLEVYSNIVQINFTAVSNNLDLLWYFDGSNNIEYFGPTSLNLTNGDYSYTFFANDTFGNVVSEQVNFSVDTQPPFIQIHSPLPITYPQANQLLNITTTDSYAINETIYNYNGTNVTYTGSEMIIFDEGSNTIDVWARDVIGNVNYANVTFEVNTSLLLSNNLVTIFNASTNWTVPEGVNEVEVLVVAGGGGGGSSTGFSTAGAGGGGAGGLIFENSFLVTPLSNISVVVGQGGVEGTGGNNAGTNGEDSSFDSLIALGGGGGSGGNMQGLSGGSGGGSRGNSGGLSLQSGSTSGGFGNRGGDSGGSPAGAAATGGGGAGGIAEDLAGVNGEKGGDGGVGFLSDITGVPTYYAGGGGGGASQTNTPVGLGGLGGGGDGGNDNIAPTSGTPNTGGGGGGGNNNREGAPGGSGVVVVKVVDEASPNIEVISPLENSSVNGQEQLLELNVTDNIGVNQIVYSYNGSTFNYENPINLTFNIGRNIISVIATDTSGNVATKDIVFNVGYLKLSKKRKITNIGNNLYEINSIIINEENFSTPRNKELIVHTLIPIGVTLESTFFYEPSSSYSVSQDSTTLGLQGEMYKFTLSSINSTVFKSNTGEVNSSNSFNLSFQVSGSQISRYEDFEFVSFNIE